MLSIQAAKRVTPVLRARVAPAPGARVIPAYAGIAALRAVSAPMAAAHGTTASLAGFPHSGTDAAGNTGSPPRQAPV